MPTLKGSGQDTFKIILALEKGRTRPAPYLRKIREGVDACVNQARAFSNGWDPF